MDLPSQPWTLSRCVSDESRDALARFWIAAPVDQLEVLWQSPVGDATRQLVRQLSPASVFSAGQVAFRDALNARFQHDGLSQPLGVQLMLANFLYSPPGLLKINNVDQHLPSWLAQGYRELYEAQPQPSATVATNPNLSGPPPGQFQAPDFGRFPDSLQELVGNRIQLNRILGLSNLYYIDPEDREISSELIQLRAQLNVLIQKCPEQLLEQLWASDLGDRYWAMVRSGVQKETLSPADQALRQTVTDALNPSSGGGFGKPGAINAFLVAMLLFEPGSMRVQEAELKLPAWLLPHYQQIFSQPQAVQA